MKLNLVTTAIVFAIVSIILAYSVTRLVIPDPIPGSEDRLNASHIILTVGAVGPESLAFDPNGEGPYTGVADGRILKWQGQVNGWIDFAVTSSNRSACVRPFAPEMEHICGRPLGLRFDQKSGDLYISDAYLGLQVVGPSGGLATQLLTEVEGEPLHFTNDMDIDEVEDVIYFTDTSRTFRRRQFASAVISEDKTGRLIKYNRSSKEVTVLLRGLAFANGVALSKDRSFVLVAECTSCRIIRFWLKGPKAGLSETFTELPGYPDNIRRNSNGEFWVAVHSKRTTLAKWLITSSWAGKTLLKLPLSNKQLHYLLGGYYPHAIAIKLSEKGEVVKVLEDLDGIIVKFISEVEERNGKLWMGSVLMPYIAVYDL